MERPPELRQEIFELLFETANISKFAIEDKIKYKFDMTTERDIRNQIRYAERKGMEKGKEKGMEKGMAQQAIDTARRMLEKEYSAEVIAELTGLTEEQIAAL